MGALKAQPVDKVVENVNKGGFSGGEFPLDPLRHHLGILAKEPVPGRVKTRLSPPLTSAEAAQLYEVCLRETVQRLRETGVSLTLFYAGSEAYFRRTFPDIPLQPQEGNDLGERLERALCFLFRQGAAGAALVGSDSPDIPLHLVKEAFQFLAEETALTIPALDGGYVLVGERDHHPQLFRDIPWSTAHVLAETRRRVAELNLSYRELTPWDDVDDLPSLGRLLERSPASETACFVRAHLTKYLSLIEGLKRQRG